MRLPDQLPTDPEGIAQLQAWLAYVIETSIEILDHLDRPGEDLEDDELGDDQAVAA